MSTAVQDVITLTGIRARGHHGVFDHERANGQEFVVDLVCTADLSPAAASDDLSATIDYGALAQQVTAAIVTDPVDLIETLADRIAQTCLTDHRISSVQVTVHKPQAPMPVDVADVSVTMTRSRP
ncbi:dihydroneopterin aldolase [Propionibacteriaceae bacterium Y1685]|uniref:dihydroneopterin aldolase n=1 Tax=Microlunatus sp. Y1700 TaxID=3418487 RepID=UPI003B7DE09C